MSRLMADAVNNADIPSSFNAPGHLVAGYAAGPENNAKDLPRDFPHADATVTISQFQGVRGQVLDFETGDVDTPAGLLFWLHNTMADKPNDELTIYANRSTMAATVVPTLTSGVTLRPNLWVAEWDNNPDMSNVQFPGFNVVAKQYINNPNGVNIDLSSVVQHWPGVDLTPAPVPTPTPTPTPGPAMPNVILHVFGGHALTVPLPVGDDVTIDVGVQTTTPPPPPPPPAGGFHPQPIPVSSVTYNQVDNSVSFSRTIIPQALAALGITDPTAQANWTRGWLSAGLHESSYDFNAVNTTDSNATGPIVADGHPANCSRGVLQDIPPTFAKYHQAGTSVNIYDALAVTCASSNYVRDRYGILADGSNIQSAMAGTTWAGGTGGY